MRGNDLHEVRGACASPDGQVELRAYQQHLKRKKVCPPDCPSGSNYSYCINQCQWTVIATTRADSAGRFTFRNIDTEYALQLIATLPGQPGGLDGVYTGAAHAKPGPTHRASGRRRSTSRTSRPSTWAGPGTRAASPTSRPG